jgi:peptidyl-prolyl cis-trans isomerase C
MLSHRGLPAGVLAAALWLSGCSAVGPSLPGHATATPTPTSAPPTATPEPLAALVNGEPITLAAYQDEITRFGAAQLSLGIDLATLGDYRTQVLQALIDRRLLAQGARALGIRLEEQDVSQRIDELAEDLGSLEAMGAWLAANGYTTASFRSALEEEMLAAQMVSEIADSLASTADQVHARHILVGTREEAEAIRSRLETGADFAELAQGNSLDLSTRPAGGDLGWFPRGYLTVREVEETAFALAPGELSGVIESTLGFHLIETLERGEHPLSPDALLCMRQEAVRAWLTTQRQTAAIEIYAAP